MREGTQHDAVTAADLKKAARLGKGAIGKSDQQLIARDEPEMLVVDLGKRLEAARIHPTDRIGASSGANIGMPSRSATAKAG
ncbi:hypothetical protein ACVWXN_001536 [Bradyrhizobium sp. i1.4.4]